MRKQLLCTICAVLLWSFTMAQNAVNGSAVTTKNKGVEMAVITVLNADNNLVIKNTVTDKNGRFSFETSANRVFIFITSLGFNDFKSELINVNQKTNLPPFTITEEVVSLDEMVIVGEKPIVQAKEGKIIYNVEKSSFSKGTNALELVKKAPGIFINQSGNVSINGKESAVVMINNKPTHLSQKNIVDLLQSMASENIKSVEVIANPSSEYEASGTGGIVNINLKKNSIQGFSTSVTSGISYWKYVRNHTSISANYNKNRWVLFSNYSHNVGNYSYLYGTKRTQNRQNIHSHTDDVDKRKAINSKLGFDYMINENNTLGLVLGGNFHYGPGITNTQTVIKNKESKKLQTKLLALNDYYYQKKSRYSLNANYRIRIPEKYTLYFDVDYYFFDSGSKNNQPNTYYNSDNQIIAEKKYHSINSSNIDVIALSANYQTSFLGGDFKTGIKSSKVITRNRFDFYNVVNNSETIDVNKSNNFDYNEVIHSGYAQYNLPFSEKYKINLGVRVENTRPKGILTPKAGSNQKKQTNGTPYFDIFPSISFTTNFEEQNALTISYVKRIDRPSYAALNPFEYLLDELYYWKGNPFLQPQLTHRIGLQYQIKKTIIELSMSQTNNFYKELLSVIPPNKIVMIPKNIGKKQYIGCSISQQYGITSNWKISVNASVFYVHNLFNSESEQSFDLAKINKLNRLAANLSAHSSFSLPWNILGEISMRFNSKQFGSANDILEPSSQVDVGFSKKISDHWQVNLSFSDIFFGNHWNKNSYFKDFNVYSYGRGESRQMRCSITYNFKSNYSKGYEKRKSNISSETNRI